MTINSTSGDRVREQVEVLLKEMLGDIGIEINIENVPANVLFGNWNDRSARHLGTYDIMMYNAGPGITDPAGDPQSFLYAYYHSSQIPSEANGGRGWNYTRIVDPAIDKALDDAGGTLDFEKRKAAYSTFAKRSQEIVSHLYLFNRLNINAFRDNIQGWKPNPFDVEVWDAENWTTTKSR
jgi:peptide/nickel transport system substrate-binding protein